MDTRPFHVVFLVGSIGVGKRTAAKIMSDTVAIRPVVIDAFEFELRERCHAAYKLFDRQRLPVPANQFDAELDTPSKYFEGKSPRTAYAAFTKFVHENMGRDAMGRWLVDRVKFFRQLQAERLKPSDCARGMIIFDTAPQAAYERVVEYVGAENCTQIVIKRDGAVSLPVSIPGRMAEVKNSGETVAGLELAIRRAVPHLFIEMAKEV